MIESESHIEDILSTPYGMVSLELHGGDVYIHSDLSLLTPSTYRQMLDDLSNILLGLKSVGYKELRALIHKDNSKMHRFMPMLGFALSGESETSFLYTIPTELNHG